MRRKTVAVTEPPDELRLRIIKARQDISSQNRRFLYCPYCRHKMLAVFEDTRGHVETKCIRCGRTTAYNVLDTRRIRTTTYPIFR